MARQYQQDQLVPTPRTVIVQAGNDERFDALILEDGEALDISSATVTFTAKSGRGGTTKITTKTNGPSGHVAPTEGRTRFLLERTDLVLADAAQSETWWYEVRVKIGSLQQVYIWGPLIVQAAVGESA
jgi:hypothetical protein